MHGPEVPLLTTGYFSDYPIKPPGNDALRYAKLQVHVALVSLVLLFLWSCRYCTLKPSGAKRFLDTPKLTNT